MRTVALFSQTLFKTQVWDADAVSGQPLLLWVGRRLQLGDPPGAISLWDGRAPGAMLYRAGQVCRGKLACAWKGADETASPLSGWGGMKEGSF